MYRVFSLSFVFCLVLAHATSVSVLGQAMSPDEVIGYTASWEGERSSDGRPKISDDILRRMENVSVEGAWSVLRGEGYVNQFEGNWTMIHNDRPVVGRVLTAQYMPSRPDAEAYVQQKGAEAGMVGASNSWPIDMLSQGDVYVASANGKVINGTLIGNNLASAIYAKSGNGVIFDAGLRDLEELEKMEGFNAFVRGWDPTFLDETMLTGINVPIRIGRATVLPGDVVLAKREGVIFIPAHLAERVVITSEIIALRDEFGIQRLQEGTYTPGQIDSRWTEEIERDFSHWLDQHADRLPVPKPEFQEYLEIRTW